MDPRVASAAISKLPALTCKMAHRQWVNHHLSDKKGLGLNPPTSSEHRASENGHECRAASNEQRAPSKRIRGQHTCRPSYSLCAHDSADGQSLLACGTVRPAGVLDFRAKRGAVAYLAGGGEDELVERPQRERLPLEAAEGRQQQEDQGDDVWWLGMCTVAPPAPPLRRVPQVGKLGSKPLFIATLGCNYPSLVMKYPSLPCTHD